MMWGTGPCAWGFWWIFPLIGLLLCLAFVAMMMRGMMGGRGFMCMGGHGQGGSAPGADVQREIRELREEVAKLRASR
jgi:hypothetical protein